MEAATVFSENFNGETASFDASLFQSAQTGSVDAAPAGLNTSIPSFTFNAGDSATPTFDLGAAQRNGAGDTFAASFLFGNDKAYGALSGTSVFSGLDGKGGTSDVLNSLFASGSTPFTSSSIEFWAHIAPAPNFVVSAGATALLGLGFIAGLMRLRQRRSGHHRFCLSYHL
jgi:hypothetical protein